MGLIRRLDPSLVNKIAAGEVIERPASALKELLENALDAQLRRVDVLVQRGGMDCLRVVDDGLGIDAEDLPLAVASHATSKLSDVDDLFRITTLGFRGEALASIAEISQFKIRSRPPGAAGAELSVEGGIAAAVTSCSCSTGTTVEVANLFFNTPVRRKFQRTTATEMGHVVEAFTRVALAHEGVHLTLSHDDRLLFDLPPTNSWLQRIRALSGGEIADALIPVDRTEGAFRIHGFVADPVLSRGNNRYQYLFLNRRHIRDRSLSHALAEAYRGLLMTGRHPVAFLRLEIPPDQVDVNVHPMKTEVRFVDASKLYSLLLGMIRSDFLQRDFTVRGRSADVTGPSSAEWSSGSIVAPSRDHDERRQTIRQWWDRPSSVEGERIGGGGGTPGLPGWSGQLPDFKPFEPVTSTNTSSDTSDSPPTTAVAPSGLPAMQVCNRYLVTETEEGLMVIDQHALHERILYEQLRTKMTEGHLEQQRLLVPEPVELSPTEAGLLLEHRDVLQDFGMDIEPFGGNTVLVISYPAMLANLGPAEIVRRIAEQLVADAKKLDRRMLLDELLHMIACKAAIKAGDRLTPQEVTSLIEMRTVVHDSHHCPHGRPTTLLFTRADLDRQFQRT